MALADRPSAAAWINPANADNAQTVGRALETVRAFAERLVPVRRVRSLSLSGLTTRPEFIVVVDGDWDDAADELAPLIAPLRDEFAFDYVVRERAADPELGSALIFSR